MKVAIFSDLHAHAWGEFSTIVKYKGDMINSRLADSVGVINAVRDYVEDKSIKHCIFGGDLFHRKRLVDVPVFNAVAEAVYQLARRLDSLHLLAGNHDLARRSASGRFSSEHALAALSRYRNVTIVDQPAVVLDGVGIVPYADDRETTLRGLEAVSKARVLVLHAGVSGARTGAVEYQPLEPLTTADLPDKAVYSGHYHLPQELKNLTYIGAPMEFVRGDGYHKRRGFIVVNLNKPREYERIRYKGPRFVTIKASDRAMNNDDVRGNFVDLVLDDDSQEPQALVDMLIEHGAREVNTVPAPVKEKRNARIKVKTRNRLPSIHELTDAYADQHDGKLDKDILKTIAKTALQEAEASSTT